MLKRFSPVRCRGSLNRTGKGAPPPWNRPRVAQVWPARGNIQISPPGGFCSTQKYDGALQVSLQCARRLVRIYMESGNQKCLSWVRASGVEKRPGRGAGELLRRLVSQPGVERSETPGNIPQYNTRPGGAEESRRRKQRPCPTPIPASITTSFRHEKPRAPSRRCLARAVVPIHRGDRSVGGWGCWSGSGEWPITCICW